MALPIASLSDAVNKLTGGGSGTPELIPYMKEIRAAGATPSAFVTGRTNSLWLLDGSFPSNGLAPGGTARNPTSSTAGALGQANAGGGRAKYLTGMAVAARVSGGFWLCDRLADVSGLSGTTTGAQSITGLSVNRYTSTESIGNEIHVEIYANVGATPTTITASYTNQANQSGRTTCPVQMGAASFLEATRTMHLPLQTGDTGVLSVESVTLLASTGTAGDFGITIVRKLAYVSVSINGTGSAWSGIGGKVGPVPIKDNACLYMIANTVGSFNIWANAFFQFVES